jgi:predicted GH43/DUF377 family glycosyl hydrolase
MKQFFIRSKINPILKPNPNNVWEGFKIYNPGAIFAEGKYHLFYRAMNRGEDWKSSIGYAVSSDGEYFERFDKPILEAETPEEKRGLEDPRITKVDDTYYMAYAAYDGTNVRLNIATSLNLKKWTKHGKAFSNFEFLKNGGHVFKCENGQIIKNDQKAIGKERSKSGAIFPEKINGRYWMLFGEYNIWLANSDDSIHWNVLPGVFLSPRENKFDNTFVEMGSTPIKTDKGWLILYHGIDNWKTYRIGFLLLDLNNPEKILYRNDDAIFEPIEKYETQGFVDVLPGGLQKMQKLNDKELEKFIDNSVKNKSMNAVTFCCGATLIGDTLRIYYGAGDSYVCTATTSLKDILKLTHIV